MLSNVKVLDLTRVLAGPLCTMMLGDMGAQVIKVERRGSGDETRTWGPPFDAAGESAYYLSINRNKLGLEADFGDDDDRALVLRLIAESDVVVDNFRPGVLRKAGLDPDELLARHPKLIWCTISGFGETSERPGYDFVVQAECGWMAVTGEPDGAPMKTGVPLADILAGKDAAVAILAALAARGGAGNVTSRRLHISLARTAIAALGNVGQNVMLSGRDARRWGNAHPNLVPYQLFAAKDRSIVIAVGSDAQFRSCMVALGLPEQARDPKLATNAGRLEHRERLVAAIAARVSERTAAAWTEALDAAGVPTGLVRTVAEAVQLEGASASTGLPPSVPGTVRHAPPRLGEHNDAIRLHGWKAFGG